MNTINVHNRINLFFPIIIIVLLEKLIMLFIVDIIIYTIINLEKPHVLN
jgi:hypothetical protein